MIGIQCVVVEIIIMTLEIINMGYLRIKEAKSFAKKNGNKVTNITIGKRLWKNTLETTLNTNMSHLSGGRTKRVSIDWIPELCDEYGVDANFLFNIKSMQQKPTDKELEEIVNKIAYTQTAEEQIDDFLNKIHILKEFIDNKYF